MAPGIRRVTAADTLSLRQRVLRPHQTIGELSRSDDDDPDTAHFAALDDAKVIGVASARREAPPWAGDGRSAWRLRGMAISEEWRRQGVGTALLEAVVDHVSAHGGGLLWCTARTPAMPFYRRAGFVTRGEVWDDPILGPHIAMERAVAVVQVPSPQSGQVDDDVVEVVHRGCTRSTDPEPERAL